MVPCACLNGENLDEVACIHSLIRVLPVPFTDPCQIKLGDSSTCMVKNLKFNSKNNITTWLKSSFYTRCRSYFLFSFQITSAYRYMEERNSVSVKD